MKLCIEQIKHMIKINNKNIPKVYNVPNLNITKSSTSVKEAILSVCTHGKYTISGLMNGKKFHHVATALVVRIYLNVTGVKGDKNTSCVE